MQLSKWIAELSARVKYALGLVLLLLLLVLIYPFQTTIVPHWRFLVVDDHGSPVRAMNVTEHWRHYLLESEGHEEIARTEDDGQVNFPARTIRASLLHRMMARINKAAGGSGQARVDASASVVLWGSKKYQTTVAIYSEPNPPQSEISVRSLP
jgi:hypothetical protein